MIFSYVNYYTSTTSNCNSVNACYNDDILPVMGRFALKLKNSRNTILVNNNYVNSNKIILFFNLNTLLSTNDYRDPNTFLTPLGSNVLATAMAYKFRPK